MFYTFSPEVLRDCLTHFEGETIYIFCFIFWRRGARRKICKTNTHLHLLKLNQTASKNWKKDMSSNATIEFLLNSLLPKVTSQHFCPIVSHGKFFTRSWSSAGPPAGSALMAARSWAQWVFKSWGWHEPLLNSTNQPYPPLGNKGLIAGP